MSEEELDSFDKLREEVKKDGKDKTNHKKVNFDPFERMALADYKKKKKEMKRGGHKRGNQLPVDQEEWDDEDWESYYGV